MKKLSVFLLSLLCIQSVLLVNANSATIYFHNDSYQERLDCTAVDLNGVCTEIQISIRPSNLKSFQRYGIMFSDQFFGKTMNVKNSELNNCLYKINQDLRNKFKQTNIKFNQKNIPYFSVTSYLWEHFDDNDRDGAGDEMIGAVLATPFTFIADIVSTPVIGTINLVRSTKEKKNAIKNFKFILDHLIFFTNLPSLDVYKKNMGKGPDVIVTGTRENIFQVPTNFNLGASQILQKCNQL